MVFVQRVRAYKVTAKFIKRVGDTVYSVGFPVGEVEKGNLTLAFISEKIEANNSEIIDGNIFFATTDIGIKKDYEAWKKATKDGIIEEIQNSKNSVAEQQVRYNKNTNDFLVKMIQEFDLANTTPMQGLSFIQELKNHIKIKG